MKNPPPPEVEKLFERMMIVRMRIHKLMGEYAELQTKLLPHFISDIEVIEEEKTFLEAVDAIEEQNPLNFLEPSSN